MAESARAFRRDSLVESIFGASIATMEVFAIHIGDRLGSYRSLANDGDATAAELARRTGTNECIHDMANPIATLAAMRRLVGDGSVLIADERVADEPSAATGTVMRIDTFRDYAQKAGFQTVDILPIDNMFWRFYRLTA
jgi:hypothetical protein